MPIPILLPYVLIGLLCLGACTNFKADDTSSTGPTSPSGATGAGGAGNKSNASVSTVTAGGGAKLCDAQFDYPFQLGGMQCEDCAYQVACDKLQVCDEVDCKFLFDCYRNCPAMQDLPCIANCNNTVGEEVTLAFNEVDDRLRSQCEEPCGFTNSNLCSSPKIPAVTIDCLASAGPCCMHVVQCDMYPLCQKCASGISTPDCDQMNPFFKELMFCLSQETACSY